MTVAKAGLMGLTSQMQKAADKDADAKFAYDALQGVKVEAKGKVASLTAAAPAEPILKLVSEKIK